MFKPRGHVVENVEGANKLICSQDEAEKQIDDMIFSDSEHSSLIMFANKPQKLAGKEEDDLGNHFDE